MRFPILLALALSFAGAELLVAQLPPPPDTPPRPVADPPIPAIFRTNVQLRTPNAWWPPGDIPYEQKIANLKFKRMMKMRKGATLQDLSNAPWQTLPAFPPLNVTIPTNTVPYQSVGTPLTEMPAVETTFEDLNVAPNEHLELKIEYEAVQGLGDSAAVSLDPLNLNREMVALKIDPLDFTFLVPADDPREAIELYDSSFDDMRKWILMRDLMLAVPASQCQAGDILRDGSVNEFDLDEFKKHYPKASGSTWETGDFNGDGATNFADLVLLSSNFDSLLD